MILFPDILPYSFHRMRLKRGRQLDYEVIQRIYFKVTVHQILKELLLLKEISHTTLFLANSFYSFHLSS